MTLLSALQFGFPAGFLLAVAAPLLIFAYFKRESQKTKIVSSLIILRALPKRKVVQRRIKLPLRFFLELLCLLLLCTALTYPAIGDRSKRFAVLIDNSLSMNAKNSSGKSSLELATEEARRWIEVQEQSSKMTLFTSAPSLQAASPEEGSPTAITSKLDNLRSALSSDALPAAVSELAASAQYDRIIVFSDRNAAFLDQELSSGSPSGRKTAVEVRTVDGERRNIYISGLRFSAEELGVENRSIIARLGLAGISPTEVNVTLSDAKSGETLNSTKEQLSPGKITEARLSIPLSARSKKQFKVSITASGAKDSNSLTEDDNAWISSSKNSTFTALLVTPTANTEQALGLSALKGIAFTSLSPQDFANLSSQDLEKYSLLIFHQSSPAYQPKIPSLLIVPPEGNPLFPVKAEANAPKITSWAEDHPITAYLRVPLLNPAGALLFDIPSWAQEVINVEPGNIIAAGESAGVRFAASGVELLPFEGGKTPVLTILTLNLIRWLSGGAELSSNYLSGSTLQLKGDKNWIVKTPDGRIQRITTTLNESAPFVFSEPGIYQVTGIGGDAATGVQRSSEQFVVNSFFPTESQTFTPKPLEVPRAFKKDGKQKDAAPLWPNILLIVLALLFVEAVLFALNRIKVL